MGETPAADRADPAPAGSGRRRRTVRLGFRIALAAAALLAAFVCAEWLLARQERQIRASDRLDPGFVRHDATLGWTLTPRWTGIHRHHDFTATYRIDAAGRRSDPTASPRPEGFRAVLGDSFTFGMGVEDDQTFVRRLNEARGSDAPFVSFAVPGYSTDQEALLLERVVLPLRPAEVVLVVYLANDLFDNQLTVPMQVPLGKPRFEWSGPDLVLRNTPVPVLPRGGLAAPFDLRRAVLGEEADRRSAMERLAGASILIRTWRDTWAREPDRRALFAERLAPALRLFEGIVERMEARCREQRVPFVLVLVSGRSFVEQPGSLSAAVQEHLRLAIVDWAGSRGIWVVDGAAGLREHARRVEGPLFHRHDGHLTPAGHRALAAVIAAAWAGRSGERGQ